MSRLLDLEAAPVASCPSTQDLCRALAARGAPEGAAVLAGEQTAGRGRSDRTWHSPAGQGLWMSFLLRPRLPVAEWPFLNAVVSLSLAEALEDLASGAPPAWRAAVKWPNDVFGRRGKVAGVLAEAAAGALVVGVGLNIDQAESDFPPELRERASSLRLEGFRPAPSPKEAAVAFDRRLASAYRRFQEGDREFLERGLRARFYLRGARVRIRIGGRVVEGTAFGVGSGGELRVATGAGTEEFLSGEVVSFLLPDGIAGPADPPGGSGLRRPPGSPEPRDPEIV